LNYPDTSIILHVNVLHQVAQKTSATSAVTYLEQPQASRHKGCGKRVSLLSCIHTGHGMVQQSARLKLLMRETSKHGPTGIRNNPTHWRAKYAMPNIHYQQKASGIKAPSRGFSFV
jgi:hypothetical protein